MAELGGLIHADLARNIQRAQESFSKNLHRGKCTCPSCRLNFEGYGVDLTEHLYKPLGEYDEENKHFRCEVFASEYVKLFDIAKTRYVEYLTEETVSIEDFRRNYIQHGTENIPFGASNLRGVEFLYRRFPVTWSDLSYLNIPLPNKSGEQHVAFVEHENALKVNADDLVEAERYNRILGHNMKFAFLHRHVELTEKVTGFYRAPSHYGNRRGFSSLFDLVKSDRSSITDFVRRLAIETNIDHVHYMKFLKKSIREFYENLRLDQPELWQEISMTQYVEVIFNCY